MQKNVSALATNMNGMKNGMVNVSQIGALWRNIYYRKEEFLKRDFNKWRVDEDIKSYWGRFYYS